MDAALMLFGQTVFICHGYRTDCEYVSNAGGVVCTFSECSARNPCANGGECRNGYCCERSPTLPDPVIASAAIIRNCPDNTPSLNLACVTDSHCPSGYNCPADVGACCKIAVTYELPRGDTLAIPVPIELPSLSASPNNRRIQFSQLAVSGCNGCAQQVQTSCSGCQSQAIPMAAPVIRAPVISATSCYSGCPRGYTGCCGTQQASCCQQQNACPSGTTATGRSCYTSCPSGQTCSSGVCCQQPATCPSSAPAVGQCINGMCGSGYACQTSSNLCCPGGGTSNFICTDGTQAAGACIQGLCGAGFSCVNNLCCRGAASGLRCLDGGTPLGSCLNGLCPLNYQCTIGNICCSNGTSTTCPNNANSLGPCVQGMCPQGFACNTVNNNCCPTAGATCANGATSIGPCVNDPLTGQPGCPIGFSCNTASFLCCQSTTIGGGCPTGSTSIGSTVNGLCPPGFTPINNLCCSAAAGTGTCPAGTISAGPSIGGLCPPGFPLVGNTCCQPNRLHRSPSMESEPGSNYRRQQEIANQLGSCPNGQQGIGQCIGGLCGVGFVCINNLCCSISTNGNDNNVCPNGHPGVGACFPGSQCGIGFVCDTRTNLCCSPTNALAGGNSILASSVQVGGQCEQSEQCAGFSQGLASCVHQTCRCQPVAYAQGVACVRRKLLRLKFNDDIAGSEDEERGEGSDKTTTEKSS